MVAAEWSSRSTVTLRIWDFEFLTFLMTEVSSLMMSFVISASVSTSNVFASIGGSVKSNHSISLASPPNTEAISSSVALTVPACVYHLSVFFMIERFVSMSAPWS